MSQCLTGDLSSAPILDAFENYHGSFFDLDRGVALDGGGLRIFRDRLAAALREGGLSAGDRVIFCVGNGPTFPAGLAAVLQAGGSPLLLHPKSPPAELKRTALRLGARLVIADDVSSPDWQSEFARRRGSRRMARLSSSRRPSKGARFRAIGPLSVCPVCRCIPRRARRDYRKLPCGPRAAEAEARHYIATIGVTGDDAILAVAPMCHAYAYGLAVMVPLLSGAHVVSMRNFQATLAVEALNSGRVTIFPAVPAMLDVLLLDESQGTWNSVECVLTAGSPLPERTATRFREKTGITVRPLYGTTETGGIAVAAADGPSLLTGQVGPAMQGVETQIVARQ